MDIVVRNDKRYRKSGNTYRKLCCIEECILFACGEYCLKHKPIDPTLKRCSMCYRQKPHDMFVKDDITYLTCLVCVSKGLRASKRSYSKKQKLIIDLKIKLGGKCIDCGVDDLEILEFDHIDPKEKINCVRRIYNKQGIIDEADKCELRCVNCHCKKTHSQEKNYIIDNYDAKYRARAREFVREFKINSDGCEICGFYDENNLEALQFDHIDQELKRECISKLVSNGEPIDKIKEEIDKCRILCGNCHRKYTIRQMEYNIVDIIANMKQ
jgi:hypothetical protein